MKAINKNMLDRLNKLYELMKLEEYLCSLVSAGVAAEFEFHGNKAQVEEQLLNLITFRSGNPYKEVDRKELIRQHENFDAYDKEILYNPLKVHLRHLDSKVWQDGYELWGNQIEETEALMKKNFHDRHLKKECICTLNF